MLRGKTPLHSNIHTKSLKICNIKYVTFDVGCQTKNLPVGEQSRNIQRTVLQSCRVRESAALELTIRILWGTQLLKPTFFSSFFFFFLAQALPSGGGVLSLPCALGLYINVWRLRA